MHGTKIIEYYHVCHEWQINNTCNNDFKDISFLSVLANMSGDKIDWKIALFKDIIYHCSIYRVTIST